VLLNALWREADPSRAWFGTDTRASGLLVGVGLALLCPLGARRRWSGGARTLTDVAAVGSLAGLAVLMATMGDRAAALHHFGFGLTVVLAGLAVVALTGPSCRVSRFLGLRPLVWIGTRSYAIYLWHWPVFVLTRPRVDVAIDGWRLLAVRLLLTAVLAEVSWRLVEQPFRAGTVARHWRELRHGLRWRIALGAVSTVAVLASALGVGLSSAAVSPTPELLATVAVSPSSPTTLARIPPTTATTTTTALPTTTVPSAPAPVPTTAPPPPLPAGAVLAIGDSVMLAARDALISGSGGHMYVDAAIGRQPSQGLDVLQHYKDDGAFAQLSAIVVHLGTNGAMSDKLFDRLAAIVAGVPRVVVLNVRVPKSWEGQSNAAIDGGAPQRANMRLGDWHTASDQPGALGPDGVHPTRSGARIYRDVVLRELAGAPPPPTTTTTTTTAPPPPTTTTGPPATTTTTTPVGTATTLVP
ncbi:MAG: hypothetical protein QOI47_1964, partial [Actinomycetota bacterium]|nr:hypothetical protein [Actinomycetota bacterium]